MAGDGGLAFTRSYVGDELIHPPGRRGNQRMFQRQQQLHMVRPPRPRDSEESDDSVTALSPLPASGYLRPPRLLPTNLDRFLASVTPVVTARCLAERNAMVCQTTEAVMQPFYCLQDLWESFAEWSAYGVGVPFVLNENNSVTQYYVPSLSGIQLYVDPSAPNLLHRMPGEGTAAESSRQSGGRSECKVDEQSEASVTSSSSAVAESHSSQGPLFEYFEQEQPHNRRPLTDQISTLALQFPELRLLKSCELLPASWISVAWYPIYSIPSGPNRKTLEACFLTFHCLSTHSKCNVEHPPRGATGQVPGNVNGSLRMVLPVFGLASYKLQDSLLAPSGPRACMQERYLLLAADKWLQDLHVVHPDFEFFRCHYPWWRR